MKTQILFLSIVLLLLSNVVIGQTFVGEVLYRNSYEYIKLSVDEGVYKLSIPYLDGNRKYIVKGNILKEKPWEVQRGVEIWKFMTSLDNDQLVGELFLPSGRQKVRLRKQLSSISKDQLAQYLGVFRDSVGRKVVIYSRFNYLHIMSPYSEETMSLKPIDNDKFWTVSGESALFSTLKKNEFQMLSLSDRNGKQHFLRRMLPIQIKELWIKVGKDTLFAKLYLPQSESKVPACLILPGGGATSMEEYEYEARFLAANGIATLIFDKSGNGKSKGPGSFHQQDFEQKNEQYKKLFKYLQKQPQIDVKKIGIHGPSEGGRLALMMAMDLKGEVAFVNATAAPLMTMREGQMYAMNQLHRNRGVGEKDNMLIQHIWNDYYQGIIQGKINQAVINRANAYRGSSQRLFLPPASIQIPTAPRKEDLKNDRVVTGAKNISSPILLQYGENDQRVNPRKSLQNFYSKLSKGTAIETIFYKRGNHSFMTPELRICRGYADDKIKWLKKIGIL